MDSAVSITADDVGVPGRQELDVGVIGLESIHVSGPGEDRANGDEIGGAEWYCRACGGPLNEDRFLVEDSPSPESCPATDDGHHEPEPIPLSWLNSVNVFTDAEKDQVTVMISVGDPRGGFAMTVERVWLHDEYGNVTHNELRLSVPHDTDGMPHMPLKSLNDRGYYKVKDF